VKYNVNGENTEYIALLKSVKRLESDLAEAKALGNVRRMNEINDEIAVLNRRAGKFESMKYRRGSMVVLKQALGRHDLGDIPDIILRKKAAYGVDKKRAH
jgi:hypothetical protein